MLAPLHASHGIPSHAIAIRAASLMPSQPKEGGGQLTLDAVLGWDDRTADIVAAESTEAFMLSRKQFSRIAQQYPHVLECVFAMPAPGVPEISGGGVAEQRDSCPQTRRPLLGCAPQLREMV